MLLHVTRIRKVNSPASDTATISYTNSHVRISIAMKYDMRFYRCQKPQL